MKFLVIRNFYSAKKTAQVQAAQKRISFVQGSDEASNIPNITGQPIVSNPMKHIWLALLFLLPLFLPRPSFACDVEVRLNNPSDANHINLIGQCLTSTAAKQFCEKIQQNHDYLPACTLAPNDFFETGWLCNLGVDPTNGSCVGLNLPGGGADPNYKFYLGDYYYYYYYGEVGADPLAMCGSCGAQGVGDPINPASGAVYTAEMDIGAQGGAIAFKRSYNSTDTIGGDLGQGWRHSYSRSVKPRFSSVTFKTFAASNPNNSGTYPDPETACTGGFSEVKSRVSNWATATASFSNGACTVDRGGGAVDTLNIYASISPAFPGTPTLSFAPPGAPPMAFDVTRDDGQRITFVIRNGVATAPSGISARLQQTSGGFVYTDGNDNVEQYDTNGVLLSITSRSGIVQTLTYDGSQRLSAVTDTFGHAITFNYDALNRLLSVTDSNLKTTQYVYDVQSRLSKVLNNDGSNRTYVYENADFPFALTGLIDENGARYSSWTYDSQGRATSTQEANGVGATSLVYNADNSATVTDALGAVRTFTFAHIGDGALVTGISGSQCPTCSEGLVTAYDAFGFVSSRTDYNGNVTRYTNDTSRGLETSRTEAYGTPRARTILTQWHPTYRVPTQIDEPDKRTVFTYDTVGNLMTRTVIDTSTFSSRMWAYTYNDKGQVLTVDGPRSDVNDVTTFAYYTCNSGSQCGQVQLISNALGQVTQFLTYNANGQPLTIRDPNGVVTTLTYDSRSRLTSRVVGTETTTFEYWPTGLLQRAVLPDGSYLVYAYDDAHRLTSVMDGAGNTIRYTLDAAGNRTHEDVYDPSNVLAFTKGRVFDSLSRLRQDVGSLSQTVSYSYDNNGNIRNVTDAGDRFTDYNYDELNRVTSVTDPAWGITQYGHDANDNLVSVTDPRSLITNYTYNGFGDQTRLTSPDTGVTQFSQDAAGNVAQATDARSRSGTYSYDALDRVTQVAYSDQTIHYTYDQGTNGIGRLTQVTDGSGSTQWNYDAQGRVLTKQQVVGSTTLTVGYSYNSAGQLTNVTTPSGQVISYGYTNGRVTSITVNGVPLLNQVLYAPFGGTRGWNWGNGTITAREYNADGQLTTVDSASALSYAFNVDGTIASQTDDSPSHATLTDGATAMSVSASSNRMASTAGSLTRTYSYDAVGNTLGDGSRTYTYSDVGRMSSANNGVFTTTYQYNALGQRVKKSNANSTTYFVYDEAGRLLGEYDASGARIQELVWLEDIPVASIRTNEAGNGVGFFYVHTDHLNAPIKMTRPNDNAIVWRWDHDAYGNGTPSEDPDGNGQAVVFNLRFPGQYYDQESGNYYNYFRDYDPQTGRYLESDPIGLAGGSNTYVYSHGNAVNLFDQYGLYDSDEFVEDATNYVDGFADSLTFGLTRYIRKQWGIDTVDVCSKAYRAGEITDVALEIGSMGLSAGLKKAAEGVLNRKAARYAGEKLAPYKELRRLADTDEFVHHANPLFGHPGNIPTIFPTGGLPPSIHSGAWNLVLTAEHTAAHRSLRRLESLGRTAVNPAMTSARIGMNKLRSMECGCN